MVRDLRENGLNLELLAYGGDYERGLPAYEEGPFFFFSFFPFSALLLMTIEPLSGRGQGA